MNDTTVRPFMYEQVSRDCFIQFICGLAVSLSFNSLAIFVVAVEVVGFNFGRCLSSSVYVVVDTGLFDPISPMCDQSFSLLLSTVFSSNCQFHLLWKLFFFNRVDTIINFVDMELSCGLWILLYFKLSNSEERAQLL